MTDDAEVLKSAEMAMVEEATRAASVAYRAIQRMKAADAALSKLERATWTAPVDEWHKASEALNDALETVAAYKNFPPEPWWGSWR